VQNVDDAVALWDRLMPYEVVDDVCIEEKIVKIIEERNGPQNNVRVIQLFMNIMLKYLKFVPVT